LYPEFCLKLILLLSSIQNKKATPHGFHDSLANFTFMATRLSFLRPVAFRPHLTMGLAFSTIFGQ
jgi:hypothetical protein